MKLLLKLGRWMLFCLVLVMISCNDGDDNGDAFKYRRTLIVYMAAQNSLGSEGCSKLDSLEIIAGAVESQSKNDNIILFIDDDRNPRIHSIYRESDGVCYTHPVYQYPYDANSADGKTLLDALEELYQKYGYYHEEVANFAFTGMEGMEKMGALMEKLRNHPVTEFGGYPVVDTRDFMTGIAVVDQQEFRMDFPKSNVLLYRNAKGQRFVIRPSGTEPKIKIYLAVCEQNAEMARGIGKKIMEEIVNCYLR